VVSYEGYREDGEALNKLYSILENLILRASRRSRRRGSEMIGSVLDQLCFLVSGVGFQVSGLEAESSNPFQLTAEMWECNRHFGFVSSA
jgi:hypothetical protein